MPNCTHRYLELEGTALFPIRRLKGDRSYRSTFFCAVRLPALFLLSISAIFSYRWLQTGGRK